MLGPSSPPTITAGGSIRAAKTRGAWCNRPFASCGDIHRARVGRARSVSAPVSVSSTVGRCCLGSASAWNPPSLRRRPANALARCVRRAGPSAHHAPAKLGCRGMVMVTLKINGKSHTVDASADMPLRWVLRSHHTPRCRSDHPKQRKAPNEQTHDEGRR